MRPSARMLLLLSSTMAVSAEPVKYVPAAVGKPSKSEEARAQLALSLGRDSHPSVPGIPTAQLHHPTIPTTAKAQLAAAKKPAFHAPNAPATATAKKPTALAGASAKHDPALPEAAIPPPAVRTTPHEEPVHAASLPTPAPTAIPASTPLPPPVGGPTWSAEPVEAVYYINLDRDVDKRERMDTKAAEMGLPMTRWKGIDVTDYKATYSDSRISDVVMSRSPKARNPHWTDVVAEAVQGKDGARRVMDKRNSMLFGCFLSHRLLYSAILSRSVTHKADPNGLFLILEDDVTFLPGWQGKLREAMPHVPPDFDVLRIGYWGTLRIEDRINPYVYKSNPPPTGSPMAATTPEAPAAAPPTAGAPVGHEMEHFMERFPSDYKYLGTHAVLVQPATLARLIRYLDDLETIDDLDIAITHHGEGLNSYVLAEKLVLVDQNIMYHRENDGTVTPEIHSSLSEIYKSAKAWAFKGDWFR